VNTTRTYPNLSADLSANRSVGQAGGALLTAASDASGLGRALEEALDPWAKPSCRHHPGKTLADLGTAVALGGDCLADVALVRAEADVYGPVASDATVSRLVASLGADADKAVEAVSEARARARARAWRLAGDDSPLVGVSVRDPLIVDLDATLVVSHSDKEEAAPTWKKTFGFHPLTAWVDHGPEGGGEPLAVMLRAGNAGSDTAADHIRVTRQALAQLPCPPSEKILVRADCAGGTHEFTAWLAARGLAYSVGFALPDDMPELYEVLTSHDVWTPAVEADGEPRDGADVAELTGLLDLSGWPKGMRVIVRRERPHPGAQLRFEDVDGYRLTAFATNQRFGQLGALELRHRLRGRCEDRIRCGKDTGLRAMPLQGFGQNRIWCQVVMLACELTAWTQMLGLAGGPARRWEPKRLRLRLFTAPAVLASHGRRVWLRFSSKAPWAHLVVSALGRLRMLASAPT
jgi:hypothetical protein